MANKTEKINTDKPVKKGQEPLELLDRSSFETQVKEVQGYMKEHFEDEYGQDRVAHVMEKLSKFEGLETWFTERQIARLALLDVVDPSYTYEDPNRPNTHFEDVVQMAEFVYKNYEKLKEIGVYMRAEKNEIIYAIINSDIGKAGIDSSTAIAKFFNLKDEKRAQEKKGIVPKKGIEGRGKKSSDAQTIGDIMKLADLEGEEANWKAIAEYINLDTDTPREKLANMKSSEVYKTHELKIHDLSLALKENKEFSDDPEKRILLLQLAVSHHVGRELKIVESLKNKGYLYDAIFTDILDKAQACLLRVPKHTPTETYDLMVKWAFEIPSSTIKLHDKKLIFKIRDEYLILLSKLFEVDGDRPNESNYLCKELKRLEKEEN